METAAAREKERKQKQADEAKRAKEKKEEEKRKRWECIKMQAESNSEKKKMLGPVRRLEEKKGVVMVNGKERKYYDWSTSPQPSFVNKDEWNHWF